MENKKMIRFCPSCSSVNIKGSILSTATIAPIYRCIDCDFQGVALEGTAELIRQFREKLEEKRVKNKGKI